MYTGDIPPKLVVHFADNPKKLLTLLSKRGKIKKNILFGVCALAHKASEAL